MDFFGEATLRLKQQIRVAEDKQVASALELTDAAWKMRKKRGNFPEKELYALAAKRPDLNLDVNYVLTGITREALAFAVAQAEDVAKANEAGLSPEELTAYARATRPGPSPERIALLAAMMSELRMTEFEGVFALVKAIVDLRAALGEKSDGTAEPLP